MKQDKALQVYYDEKLVGTLAMTADHKVAFQYDDKWLENGFAHNRDDHSKNFTYLYNRLIKQHLPVSQFLVYVQVQE